MADNNSELDEIDLENLDWNSFKRILTDLEKTFPDRKGGNNSPKWPKKANYLPKYWFIQIKTSWDDFDINHYEVIYDTGTENRKYKDEGVRVELHLEGNSVKAKGLYDYLKQSTENLKLEWKGWPPNPGRCVIAANVKKYSEVVTKFKDAIKTFDNLISTYILTNKYVELLKSNKNLILTGPPGTGKTYLAKQIASELILRKMKGDEVKNSNITDYCGFVQFHPSYDYTDFVEGLRPTDLDNSGDIGFELRPGVFKKFCDNAKAHKDKNYVFIIDEINRGDISKIFGELFFSIDPEYRGEKGAVETQYSNMHEPKEKFYVPENVYIIGTMNDIDRSVESMDFAMRRRFSWREITAKESTLTMGLPKPLIDKMNNLNVAIDNTEGLNSSFHIGGAYFLGKDEDYNDIWEMRLEPLLREYLRGQPNIETEIKKLKDAYDGKDSNYDGNPSEDLDGLTTVPIKRDDLLKKLFEEPHNRTWEMGDCHYKNYFWYIQVKTIWDKDLDIHYEVIYGDDDEMKGNGSNYKDEGVRVELHLEGKYKKNKAYVNEVCDYLIKNTEADEKNLTWKDWKECGREHNGRCKYKKEIKNLNDIIEGFEYLMKVFDPLLAEYQPKMLKTRLEKNHNLILTGAPGTGKTYLARQIAKQMIGVEKDEELNGNEQYGFVQFHPSYDYTDFVEGLRPTEPDNNGNISFELKAGVFKEFCKKALENEKEKLKNKEEVDKFVFVIDEINRGDISKIFGELFFSIDPGYRGVSGKVKTQYQNLIESGDTFYDGFYVPENVYIIGTMNDIDRSVESMDFAMRRRFNWYEVKADARAIMLKDLENGEEAMKRMNNLNRAIQEIEGLGSAYHIGPSYFLKLSLYKNDPDGGWNSLWNNHIKGVLYEYLRGDDKIEEKISKLNNAYNLMA